MGVSFLTGVSSFAGVSARDDGQVFDRGADLFRAPAAAHGRFFRQELANFGCMCYNKKGSEDTKERKNG